MLLRSHFARGRLDPTGNAWVSFDLVVGDEVTTLEARIDTGFTGFVQIPYEDAVSRGVIDYGRWTQISLADGSEVLCPLGLARVQFMGSTMHADVLMPPGATLTLVGMKFLQKFEAGVMISQTLGVNLISEQALAGLVEQIERESAGSPVRMRRMISIIVGPVTRALSSLSGSVRRGEHPPK